jgi:hypothetical protein
VSGWSRWRGADEGALRWLPALGAPVKFRARIFRAGTRLQPPKDGMTIEVLPIASTWFIASFVQVELSHRT